MKNALIQMLAMLMLACLPATAGETEPDAASTGREICAHATPGRGLGSGPSHVGTTAQLDDAASPTAPRQGSRHRPQSSDSEHAQRNGYGGALLFYG